ncbi:T9SS type A sorting domain-containing protein [Changchengzhania lutea]|uniref:T9SS type A sorting domain-containing protein n=1 Tax=Changchengzhania lutea TaxID=2049305 RepID=UPI00163D4FFE|nr:T9SS type A sorting domain-containing protein [Changchengzhania lutea]
MLHPVAQQTGNSSATIAELVRNGGQVWAGAFVTVPSKIDFSTNPYIKYIIWTDAPVGTKIDFKLEDAANGAINTGDISRFTTVSGAWETLVYDFTGTATIYDKLTFLPNNGTLGDGSSTSTFYYDNITQTATASAENFNVQLFSLFPNPTKNSRTVKTKSENISSIKVFDILGKNVLSIAPNSNEATIEGASLKAGLYFAQVKKANGASSLKLVKQ